MQVILLQRVEKLGNLGEVVNVRSGYARNFLLPRKVALRATAENVAHFEKEKEKHLQLNLKEREKAEELAKKLADTMVVIIRQAGESGHLYGSVSARDIAEAVADSHVTKNHVKLDAPIRTLGIHIAHLLLHPEVSVPVHVNVAMSEDEAKAQAQTQANPEPVEIADEVVDEVADVVSEEE